ncbi:MAG: hypothetical protein FWD06_10630 [Oscillospiraceae bacterium]|nr:hypothetical protein [Oscillospiraceae bacterium]
MKKWLCLLLAVGLAVAVAACAAPAVEYDMPVETTATTVYDEPDALELGMPPLPTREDGTTAPAEEIDEPVAVAPALAEPAVLSTVPLPAWDDGNESGEAVAREWVARMEKFLQADATRVEYRVRHFRVPEENRTYTTEDGALIARWKALLPQLDLHVMPDPSRFFLDGGGNRSVTAFAGDERITLINDATRINLLQFGNDFLRVVNIDEVQEEFTAVLNAMGIESHGFMHDFYR